MDVKVYEITFFMRIFSAKAKVRFLTGIRFGRPPHRITIGYFGANKFAFSVIFLQKLTDRGFHLWYKVTVNRRWLSSSSARHKSQLEYGNTEVVHSLTTPLKNKKTL